MPEKIQGETREAFIARCIPQLLQEGKSQDEAVATCTSMYDAEDKPKKTKFEIIVDFKKLLERNGLGISEEKLEALFNELRSSTLDTKMTITECKLDTRTDRQEIKIFPKKKIFVSKYNQAFDFNDLFFTQVIDNFNNPKLFRPFGDEQHELGVKYFDIDGLEIKEDGLYATIDLNDLGREAIGRKKYSYISPQWGDRIDTDGNSYNNVLMAVTLTNIPALEGEIPTLQEQITLQKEKNMDFDKKVIELSTKIDGFKLQGEIDPAVVMSVLTESLDMIEQLKAKLQEVVGEKEVVEEAAEEAQAQLTKIKVEKEASEMESFFLSAIEKGKIEPKDEEALKKLYALDQETVTNMVNSKEEKEEVKLSSSGVPSDNKLTEEDYYVMKERELDKNNPEHVKIYLDANK